MNYIRPWNPTANTEADTDISLGGSNDRFNNLYLSGGAYIGGTGAANKLDDYEEGTWTPQLADATTGGNTASPAVATGSYTKIGRQVSVHAVLGNINTSGMTSTNVLRLRNLPFASNATDVIGDSIGFARVDNINFTGYITLELANGNDHCAFIDNIDSSGDVQLLVSAILSSASDIIISMTYNA